MEFGGKLIESISIPNNWCAASPRICRFSLTQVWRSRRSIRRSALLRVEKVADKTPGATRAAALGATAKHWWPAISLHQQIAKIVIDALPDAIHNDSLNRSTPSIKASGAQMRALFNSASGYGTLGYGLPAVSALRLAACGGAMVLIGDGGLQFYHRGTRYPRWNWASRSLSSCGIMTAMVRSRPIWLSASAIRGRHLHAGFSGHRRGFGCHATKPQNVEELASACAICCRSERSDPRRRALRGETRETHVRKSQQGLAHHALYAPPRRLQPEMTIGTRC